MTQNTGNVTSNPLYLQPLKVVDPDHPLAALVRKAQADSPTPTPPTTDGAAVQPSQVEYSTDCEYLAERLNQQGRGAAERLNQQGRGAVETGTQVC